MLRESFHRRRGSAPPASPPGQDAAALPDRPGCQARQAGAWGGVDGTIHHQGGGGSMYRL